MGIQSLSGQSINLNIVQADSSWIDMTWNSPAQAVSCEIVYESVYDTVYIAVASFTNDSIRIARQQPHGPSETITINFKDSKGKVTSDVQGLVSRYGGIVVLEEDVFIKQVIKNCGSDGELTDSLFYFVNACLVADKDLVCSITKALMPWLEEEPYPQVELLLSNQIVDSLGTLMANGSPHVSSCEDINQDDIVTSFRKAADIPSNTQGITAYPNPFSKHIILRFEAEHVDQSAHQIRIYTPQGALQWQGRYEGQKMVRIESKNWSPGLYIVQITGNGYRAVRRLLKN
jgi:hypothetical protein